MNEPIKCFIECLLPITSCNIKCHYCYVVQRNNRKMKKAEIKYSPQIIAKALRKERLGGAAYISICGAGETLMQKELPDIMLALLKEGHYLNVTTNGTVTHVFKRIAEFIPSDLLRRVNFSFSYHYIELKKKNWVGRFFENVKFVHEIGCSYVVQLNLCDEYIEYFEEIKNTCLEHIGALPQLAATRDEINLHSDIRLFTRYSKDEYMQLGEQFDSPLFRFTMQNFMVKRKEFCYAGKWSFVLDLSTGILKPCYASQLRQNIFEDINKPIMFTAIGKHCPSPFCMNSSHFISMGVIPTIKCPTYAELRNRKCLNGGEWYNDTMKEVLSQRLYDNNSCNVVMAEVKKQFLKDKSLQVIANLIPDAVKKIMKRAY